MEYGEEKKYEFLYECDFLNKFRYFIYLWLLDC